MVKNEYDLVNDNWRRKVLAAKKEESDYEEE